MNPDRIAQALSKEFKGKVQKDVRLAPYTSYQLGGESRLLVEPVDEESVRQALQVAHEFEVPLLLLGHGSNMLIADEGWPGVTLLLADNLADFSFDGSRSVAGAGASLLTFIESAVSRGLHGMELMAGIPGTIGGGLRMNAGAFGQEIESTVKVIRGFERDGTSFSYTRDQISFGYRQAPELDELVITSAEFEFEQEEPEILQERMRDTIALRAKKQPLEHPSCGSVFKRPVGYYAGALIEESGFKGYRVGGAMVSPKHAGFILNTGDATARDVFDLIRTIQEAVDSRFGVKLEREVKLVGFEEAGYAVS